MQILRIVLGIVLLVFGRRIFWLTVGIIGFLFGLRFALTVFSEYSLWVQLGTGLGLGVIGIVLAIYFERIMFAIAGFFAGAYVALASAITFNYAANNALLILIGGVAGMIIAILTIDWAIILISSIVGAGAIVLALQANEIISIVVYVALVVIGIYIQSQFKKQDRKKRRV